MLRAPDFQKPFLLAVDACDVDVGAVDDDDFEKPVAYFSQKTEQTPEGVLHSGERKSGPGAGCETF